MSDLSALERETLAAIQSAPDEGALEAARVAALGKKGSISALLATLGKLAPDERKNSWRGDQCAEGPGHGSTCREARSAQARGA